MHRFLILFLCLSFFFEAKAEPKWQQTFQKLDDQEKKCLESFFYTMLTDSEGGYVLFGSKPACGEGILRYSSFFEHDKKAYNNSAILYEGWRTWKKYFSLIPSKNLIICCKKNVYSINEWAYDLYWVHRSKLLEIVKNNLQIFQYVLGPSLSPESFLNFFLDPNQLLPKDQTLIGLFLGFGTKNSLFGKRSETIFFNFAICEEMLPLAPRRKRMPVLYDDVPIGIYDYTSSILHELQPSFCYQSISDEWLDLRKKHVLSTEKSPKMFPKTPTFGIFAKDKETKKIQKDYEIDQKKIKNLLTRNDFLFQTLKIIFEK